MFVPQTRAMEDEWQVVVTNADIRAAKTAWLAALDANASDGRIQLLRRDLESLWRAQARQVAAEFRANLSAG